MGRVVGSLLRGKSPGLATGEIGQEKEGEGVR